MPNCLWSSRLSSGLGALATENLSWRAGISLGISIIEDLLEGCDGLCEPVAANLALGVRASDIASGVVKNLSLPLLTFFAQKNSHVSGIIAVVCVRNLKAVASTLPP